MSAANAKKPKVDGEMIKRLVVGFAAMAWYLIPMYVHPFMIGPVSIITASLIHSETFNIYRKDFEESDNAVFRFCFLFFAYLWALPRYGILERTILENSGYTAQKYPLLFKVLYERNSEIILVAFSILFIWLICQWRARNIKYQMRKAIPTFCLLMYTVFYVAFQGYIYMTMGRWFTYFGALTVACNDTFAYFAGKFFGKHHLIGLSPNKTVEGWIGGLVSNVLVTVFVAKCIMMKGTFWICAPNSFNYGLFEDYHCDTLDPIFVKQEIKMPLINESVTIEPAILYTIIYALFATIIAPYAGFFGSGLKRAVGIKDFAATLPGHGGFIDRVDCQTLICMFSYYFVTLVIQGSSLQAKAYYNDIDQHLEATDKLLIANQLAERLNLPQITI